MTKVKNIKKALLILFVLGFTQTVFAQDDQSLNSNGSFYSLFGIGYPFDNTSARESALGILGVSLNNRESNSLQNPAIWGNNAFTTASSGFKLSRYIAKDGNSQSINALLETGYLQLTLPILRQKLGFSASVYPVTRSNYRIYIQDAEVTSPGDTINFVTDLEGSGGVNKIEFGLGWNITDNISLGYAPSLAFISRNNSETVYFAQNGYSNNFLDQRVTGITFAQRFGTMLSFYGLLNQNDQISIGATFALPISIDAKQKNTVMRTIDGSLQEIEIAEKSGTVKVPAEVSTGLTYYPSEFLNISLEGQLQKWSKYNSELQQTPNNVKMSDRYRLGIGTEYHPYRFNSDKILSNFRYSAGFSYDTGHMMINNEKIDTYWLSAGIGIPSRSRSSVDISFRYGIRGTTSKNLIQENIWSINLSVNLSELMFIRPKLD